MDCCCCVVIRRWRVFEWEIISCFTKLNSRFHVRINDAYQPDWSIRWIKSNRMIFFNCSYKTGFPWLWTLSLSLPCLRFTQVLCTNCTRERHRLCDMSCVLCVSHSQSADFISEVANYGTVCLRILCVLNLDYFGPSWGFVVFRLTI